MVVVEGQSGSPVIGAGGGGAHGGVSGVGDEPGQAGVSDQPHVLPVLLGEVTAVGVEVSQDHHILKHLHC